MRKVAFGIGESDAEGPYARGASAARAARDLAGPVAPALAILAGDGGERAAEVVRGVRQVLGNCPLVGRLSASTGPPGRPERARVILLSSPHLAAKVGAGGGAADVGEEVDAAFRGSWVADAEGDGGAESTEERLFRWYSYRQPSLAVALVAAEAGELPERRRRVAAFLRGRFQGRVPFLVLPFAAGEGEPVLVADDRVLPRGVLLVTVKTDLLFRLQRLHEYEPLGERLIVTRTAGRRVLELNGRRARDAYRESVGLTTAPVAPEVERSLFSLFPPATRGRDGRYNLLLPEGLDEEGALLLPVPAEEVPVLFPMRAVSSFELGHAGRPGPDGTPPHLAGAAAAILLRNTALRDHVLRHPGEERRAGGPVVVEFAVGPEMLAHLGPGEDTGGSEHLLLVLRDELDPVAEAARENERLLREVMHFKQLNQSIFDGIGHGIALLGPGRKILHCNETYRNIMGKGGELPEGCPLAAADGGCRDCVVEQALRQGSFATRDVSLESGSGRRWLRIDAFPIAGGSEGESTAVEVIRDVTEFKRLGESLASEQRKMNAVIRGMAEALYIVGPGYELQFLHRGLFPFPPGAGGGDPAGRTCHEAIFGREMPCQGCRLQETVRTGQVTRRVAELPVDGEPGRFFQVTLSPWAGDAAGPAAAVGLLVDISAQRRLERQLIRSEKLNSLAILSAGMAHELNNPLGAISFNLEILGRRSADPEQGEILASIRRDVARITRIVGNLHSFSRGGGATAASWVRLDEVIDSAFELFHAAMERRRIEIRREYAPGTPAVWGNAQDLQQVFVNLVSNAIDAMPSGGAIRAAVGVEADGGGTAPLPVAVVYDHPGDLAVLRSLLELSGCEVRFYRGADEIIAFHQGGEAGPPEVVILDLADPRSDDAGFFLTMLGEFAPAARLIAVVAADGPAEVAGPAGPIEVLRLPFTAERLRDRVGALAAEARSSRAAEPAVRVVFADTGSGIPRDLHERVFDPFFTTKDNKGTGLGLSVVHKILHNHEAVIRVDGTARTGTEFVISFAPGVTQGAAGAAGRER